MERLPVSCFIIAMNEADRIGRTIECVRDWVDEVVVVDSGSTDETVAIAEALGARVIYRGWTGYGEQKRFGEDSCRNDWVLNLDADEVLSSPLIAEIKALFRDGQPAGDFYRFRLLTVYPGDAKPRLWADYHNYIRLYDRRKGRFAASPVHDEVDPQGAPTVQLSGVAHHFSYRSLSHLIEKLNGYTDLQGKAIDKRSWVIGPRLVAEFPLAFFKYYVMRRHFTGGLKGFVFAFTIAAFRVIRLAKIGGVV